LLAFYGTRRFIAPEKNISVSRTLLSGIGLSAIFLLFKQVDTDSGVKLYRKVQVFENLIGIEHVRLEVIR
jgi:hypothetical protein